jgi:anti-sigma28 factor (negative regulator of flagellin synthesis)
MRIDDLNPSSTSSSESSRAQETQRTGRNESGKLGGAAASGSGDRVEFSSSLEQLSQAITVDSFHREARVSRLAVEYEAGRYRPDSRLTSQAMVAEALSAGSADA